jgi:hypothetical protein
LVTSGYTPHEPGNPERVGGMPIRFRTVPGVGIQAATKP